MSILVSVGAVAVAGWLYLLLGRGWFWREAHKCSTWNSCGKAQSGNELTVVAVVPARNERETIGRSVMSLLGQEFAGTLCVIVVDDQSADGTAEAARAAETHICQQQADVGHPQLKVINGKPVPEGWTGKVWAMQQGIEAARELKPKFFLLTDADVVHAPDNVARLVAMAERDAYDLTSLMVRLHCESVAERLLIPAFVLFFFMLYPPRWIADPRKATAGAAGGCMLLRPEALERAGGMAAIRGEVIDDCALARAIKAQGKAWLGLSNDTASVRPYGSFGEIGRMIARSAFNQLRHSGLLLAGALVGMVIMFVVPVGLVLVYPTLAKSGLGWATHGPGWASVLFLDPTSAKTGQMWGTLSTVAMVLGGLAWSLMTLAYLPMVRFYRLNPLWAATLPAAACFYMGATLWSAVKYWTGRGGEWKGRMQDRR